MNTCVDYKELGGWGSGRVSKLIKMFYEADSPCTLLTNEVDMEAIENIANYIGVECINPDSKMIKIVESRDDIVHKLIFSS